MWNIFNTVYQVVWFIAWTIATMFGYDPGKKQ